MLACSHRPPCPGCPRWGERGLAPAVERALRELVARRDDAVLDDLVEGERTAYRVRARLAVRGRPNSPKVGVFQAGSHRIVDIPGCLVHHAAINGAAAAIKRAVRGTRAVPYHDAAHRGLVRYVQLVVERRSGRIQATVVCNEPEPGNASRALCAAVADELGDAMQAVFWNGQPERSNAILGDHWEKVAGADALVESIAGVDVVFPPGAFGQASLDLFETLASDVRASIPADRDVFEGHAGCGPIGLGLLASKRRVTFNEIAHASLEGLRGGLGRRPESEQERASVRVGPIEERLDALESAPVVIVDPPRKGLGKAVVSALGRAGPDHLVYVACGFDAFVREVDALTADHRLRLERVRPYGLFPHTAHVECVGWLRRV